MPFTLVTIANRRNYKATISSSLCVICAAISDFFSVYYYHLKSKFTMLTNYLRFFQKKYEKANSAIDGINQQNPVLFLPCHHSTFSQNNGVSPLEGEHSER